MRRQMLHVLLACAAAVAGMGMAAAQVAPAAVSSNQASVTVKVTPQNLEGSTWDFHVVFDTHSQELGDDLLKSSVLVAPDGSEIAPLEWTGAPPGGHHREGVLRFQAPTPRPAAVTLRITRAGEASPRSFAWTLP